MKSIPRLPNPPDLPPTLARLFAEPISRSVLDNDLTVVHRLARGSGLASVQLWIKSGSIHEGPWLGAGVSHFCEHLFFKGTTQRSGTDFTRQLQEAGAYINAYTTFDRTVYYIDTPTAGVPLALELLAEAASLARFDPAETERERDVIRREIDMGKDDPDRELSRALFRTAFRDHPFRFPVIGSRQLLDGVSRDELFSYYTGRYNPANAVLVVTGDVDALELERLIQKTFGTWLRQRLAPVVIPAEPPQLGTREMRQTGDVNVVRGTMAFRIPSFAHEDAAAIDLLAFVLGHGHSSWLWRRLREERDLVHQIDVSAWNPGAAGLLWINWIADPGERERVESALREELERASHEALTASALERAWRQTLAAEVNARKTVSGQAARLGLAEVVVGDLGYPRHYLDRLRQMRPEDLERVAERYLRPELMTVVSSEPAPKRKRAKAAKATVRAEAFAMETRPNGARLVWRSDPALPKVHFRVVCRGGPLSEPAPLRGITGLLATMLVRDTSVRSSAAVAAAIEEAGGAFHEFSGNNTFGLATEVLVGDEALGLGLLSDALHRPIFLNATLVREREAQAAQIKEDLDEIVDFGRKALRRKFFGDHPFRIGPYGLVETVEAITVADVRAHYKRLVRASNVVLSICGDFDEATILPQARELLDGLPALPFTVPDVSFAGPPAAADHQEQLPREQAVVFEAYPDAGLVDDDYEAGSVLDEILSEMSGRLFGRVREELGLAYFVGAGRVVGVQAGMFFLYAGTHPDTVARVQEEFAGEVQRIREGGLTAAEVDRCRTRLQVQRRQGLQTIGARAMQAAMDLVYDQGLNHFLEGEARLAAVTPAAVADFALRRLDPARRVRLVVRP